MDLAKIIAQAQQNKTESVSSVPAQESVQTLNDVCECGHDKESHEPDETGDIGECNDCECESFYPKSQSYDLALTTPANPLGLIQPIVPTVKVEVVVSTVEITKISSSDITEVEQKTNCAHLCSKCNKWWTHGSKDKCRYPDLMNQGMCFPCLNGAENADPLDDFEETKDGKQKLTTDALIRITNEVRLRCKDMSIEQLTYHIAFNSKRIMELQAASMAARKMRVELEEDKLKDIPESEREKFRQEYRNGLAKVKKVKTEKQELIAKTKEEKMLLGLAKSYLERHPEATSEEAFAKAKKAFYED